MAGIHRGREHSGRPRVCIDDFGLHPGVNEAVAILGDAGIADAASCMVGAPYWPGSWRALSAAGRPELGLHLDFTEWPLQPAARRDLPALIAGSYLGRLDRPLIRSEIRAQLDAFEDAIGQPPRFVDGHQHVHQLPLIREALLEELVRRGGPRPWLRSTRRPAGAPLGGKAWLIERLGAHALGRLAAQAGLAQNERLLGVYDFRGGAGRYRALLDGWLAAARPGDLLMCHPSAASHPSDPLDAARRAEFEVLLGCAGLSPCAA